MAFYGDQGHCPHCGKFCGGINGTFNDIGLVNVEGDCKQHGIVDLTDQDWSYDDFKHEETHDG